MLVIARPLDVLATGETTAQSLGLDLARWRVVIVILAGLLTAGAVIQGGTIGFVGLVIPHLVRLAFGTAAHRIVVPAAALAGGTLLAAADLVARTAAAPRQLPVGAIMALLGVPVFLVLLRRLEGRARIEPMASTDDMRRRLRRDCVRRSWRDTAPHPLRRSAVPRAPCSRASAAAAARWRGRWTSVTVTCAPPCTRIGVAPTPWWMRSASFTALRRPRRPRAGSRIRRRRSARRCRPRGSPPRRAARLPSAPRRRPDGRSGR